MPLATAHSLQLHNGDRMSREEFFRRWEQMPELKKAELIDGVVYVPSPTSRLHANYDNLLGSWLRHYAEAVGNSEVLSSGTWLLSGSSPQPDCALIRERPAMGESGKYPDVVPDLVIEVAYSSRSYDLGPKLDLYRRSGVPEYLCVLLEEQRVEWRALRGTRYELLQPDSGGTLRSKRLAGLWLDTTALFPPDFQRLLAALERGIASRQA